MSQGKFTFEVESRYHDEISRAAIMKELEGAVWTGHDPFFHLYDIEPGAGSNGRVGWGKLLKVKMKNGKIIATILLMHLDRKMDLVNNMFDIYQYAEVGYGLVYFVYRPVFAKNGCHKLEGYEVE